MNQEQIKAMQAKIGTVPDGFWGMKSITACQKYLRSLMPSPNPWPGTSQAELTAFYGRPGDESKLVNLPVEGLGVKYDGVLVRTVLCHAKVADSLHRVLSSLARTHPEILEKYAGCYNNRNMRGGSLPSLHARGAAIDLWPEKNGNHTVWPTRAMMPLEIMGACAKEGALSAGAYWSRDSMHQQFTR